MEITHLKITDLVENKGQIPDLPTNPRQWKKAELEKLKKSLTETPELFEARGILVYPFASKFVVLGGNMRLSASRALNLKEVPCIIFPEDTPKDKLKEIVIKDNGAFGGWDFDLLANEWDDLPLTDWGVPAWDSDEPEKMERPQEGETTEDDFDDKRDKVQKRCESGDLWRLGEHLLICGDSTSALTLSRLMDGTKADLVFTDPPYGMKKEKDGVLNDNLNFDDLLDFNKRWIPLSFENLKENGSWYCWGTDEPLMDIYSLILKPMQRKNEITFRNFITWKKESDNPTMIYNGACCSSFRSFYSSEKCLFVMSGVEGFNNNSDHYDDTFEPIRAYMEEQAKKVGLTPSKLKEICGCGMYSHWFTKSQFTIITESHYKELQNYFKGEAFLLEYDEMVSLFDDEKHKSLKEAVMAKRAYFNPDADLCLDVWVFDVTSQKERELCGGHATPKPLALCGKAIKMSSREGETVLDLFGGSGSTMMACEQLGRKCRMIELDPRYCDVILARWEKLTGKEAVKV